MPDQSDYLPLLLRRIEGASSEDSASVLAQAANDHPTDARPLLLLGGELAGAGKIDGAEAAYTVALQRAPEFWIARFQLGLLQFTSGRPAIALVTWAPLDQLDTKHYLRLFKQAFERLAEDDFESASRLLREGIQGNLENAPLNGDMNMLLGRLIQQGFVASDTSAEPPNASTDEHFLVSTYRNAH